MLLQLDQILQCELGCCAAGLALRGFFEAVFGCFVFVCAMKVQISSYKIASEVVSTGKSGPHARVCPATFESSGRKSERERGEERKMQKKEKERRSKKLDEGASGA